MNEDTCSARDSAVLWDGSGAGQCPCSLLEWHSSLLAAENPESGGKWGGKPCLGEVWSWWKGWKGFLGTGTEGGMCLETNPAGL